MHVVPVPVPSALLLPGTVGAHLARVWQKRPKTKFVLCIQDPAYTEGLGRRWLRSPTAEAAQIPQPLTTPASYRHAHTHTHT